MNGAAGALSPADCCSVGKWVRQSSMTDVSHQSDSALLAAYAAGDRMAARYLADRLLPRVMGQAMRMLADRAAAEDVAQEAMLRLWRIASDWREGEAQISTWLYRVTANLCTDQLRKRRGNVDLDEIAEPADPQPGVTTQIQTNSRQMALTQALAALPERQAQAVALRHLEGLSNPEIADIMDITVTSVESLTARGKRALAVALADQKDALGYQDDR